MLRVSLRAGYQRLQQELEPGRRLLIGRGEDAGSLRAVAATGSGPQLIEAGLRTLSQEHVCLSTASDGQVVVEDLGSTNGTYLRLAPNERVEIPIDAELLLGRELTVSFSSPRWSADRLEASIARKPEELLSFIRNRLGNLATSVRLARPRQEEAGSASDSALRLPLADPEQLIVEWQARTYDIEAESWLRTVVSLYNSQRADGESAARPWVFTAISPGRQQALWLAKRVAASSCTVLIRGASGSGKEILANDLHNHSPRCEQPFIAVNCGAIQANLAESALFGHKKGAFTGATENHIGLLEQANGGTLFLDEIGEMPLDLQVKLLRVIETRKVKPVGSTTEKAINIRIIAATHRPLEQMVQEKTFREDLFYRLSTIQLFIPAIEPDDIEAMARIFLGMQRDLRGIPLSETEVHEIARHAARHAWPGGVRELRNAIERYLLLRDQERSIMENWELTLATGTPGASRPDRRGGTPSSPPADPAAPGRQPAATQVPERAPLSIRKQIDNLMFLSVLLDAVERDPRIGISTIAERVDMTYQGVVNRLKSLDDLKLDGRDAVQRIRARIAKEQELLGPYAGWIRSVLGPAEQDPEHPGTGRNRISAPDTTRAP
jgi:DNA-binding NtrC family response regulator